MSEKKTPTVAKLQKQIAKQRKSENEAVLIFKEFAALSEELVERKNKEIEDLKKSLTQSRADYQRACDIARHLSRAVNILTENRYE